jgi:hypothetical protein
MKILIFVKAPLPAWTFLSLFMLAVLPSCMSLRADKHTYQASSPAVVLNGASIRMQVRPEGTDGGSYALSAMVVTAAVATFDGPFRWRIEAIGITDKHDRLIVHRIRTRTSVTKRDEWFPIRELGKYALFKDAGEGMARAIYPIPGMLQVKPREDGTLTLDVDASVIDTRGRSQRKLLRFSMNPAEGRADEFVFIPTEIVSQFGKSADERDDKGWD